MKKLKLLFPISFILILLLSSCLTASQPIEFTPFTKIDDKPLYPAIYTAVSDSGIDYFSKCNINNDTYLIESIIFDCSSSTSKYPSIVESLLYSDNDRYMGKIRFDLSITVVNDTLVYDILNLVDQGQYGEWEYTTDFHSFSTKKYFKKINDILENVMKDDTLYENALNTCLSDYKFLLSILKDSNEMAINEFVKNTLLDRTITLEVKFHDFIENVINTEDDDVSNDVLKYPNYKYKLGCFTPSVEKEVIRHENKLYINFYTNNKNYINNIYDDILTIKGNIVDIRHRLTINIDMLDN